MNIFKQVARHEHFIERLLYIRYSLYLIFKMSWQVFAHFMSEEMKIKVELYITKWHTWQ